MESTKEGVLDVAEDRIKFEVPGKLELKQINLPYKVHADQGRAKFDRDLQLLTITLPTQTQLYQPQLSEPNVLQD